MKQEIITIHKSWFNRSIETKSLLLQKWKQIMNDIIHQNINKKDGAIKLCVF